jgi:hypothetical protein
MSWRLKGKQFLNVTRSSGFLTMHSQQSLASNNIFFFGINFVYTYFFLTPAHQFVNGIHVDLSVLRTLFLCLYPLFQLHCFYGSRRKNKVEISVFPLIFPEKAFCFFCSSVGRVGPPKPFRAKFLANFTRNVLEIKREAIFKCYTLFSLLTKANRLKHYFPN